MDRKRLDLLVAQANALASALCATSDTNDNAKQRCLHLAAEVNSFVKAWSNLSKALHDPQLRLRPAFSQIFDRVLNDCVKIINDLRSQLSEVKTKQAQHDAAAQSVRFLPKRRTTHLLVSFFGRENISLRQQQVLYAISVLDVILGVVLHAKTLGYEPSTQQEAQTSLQDQLARLKAESDARILVLREESRFGDKYVITSRWLDSVTWDSDSFQVPPFETLALQWFLVVPDEDRHVSSGSGESHHDLVRAMKQLQQDMREQTRRHDEQIRKHEQQHEALRNWAEGTITQIEFSQQKTKKEADSRIEEMRSQLEVQKQKIESDAATMQQLRFSQREWGSSFQKQATRFQQLEGQMAQQQTKLESLQQKYDRLLQSNVKLQQQNQTLRRRLDESETQKQAVEEQNAHLKERYSKAVTAGKRWKELYESGPGDREAMIEELQEDIQVFKEEIASLRSDLAQVTGNRDELRQSLTNTEKQRDRYRERLASVKPPCQPAYDNVTSPPRRRSRSRHHSDVGVPQSPVDMSRGSSRDGASRSGRSSATYVNDYPSDSDSTSRRRTTSGSTASSSLQSWFSTKPRQRSLVVSNR